jgi:anti-sigma regulatory factor (Ser/Thr protein kinase)
MADGEMAPKRSPARQPPEFRLVLSPNPAASSRAREAIRGRFNAALSTPVLEDLLAVVSELVNNAVTHGPGRPITVTLVMGDESIRGEVSDQGNPAAAIPKIKEATSGSEEGLGLTLVDRLTAGWAVYEGSTNVWFELPLEI